MESRRSVAQSPRTRRRGCRHSDRLEGPAAPVVDTLGAAIEFRGAEPSRHILRIRLLTRALLAQVADSFPEYRLTSAKIDMISSAAALHDVGKAAIPDTVLLKPGSLTPEEFALVKTHSLRGYELLNSLGGEGDRRYLELCRNICRYHHERWDGAGYPEGLGGENIPICAQVVSLVDAYDALTHDRPYRRAVAHEKAVQMILNGECGAFSPKLLECFKVARGALGAITRRYADGGKPSPAVSAVPPQARGMEELAEPISSQRFGHMKYSATLQHLDSTVTEIDLNTGLYHVVSMAQGSHYQNIAPAGDYGCFCQEFLQAVYPEDRQGFLDHVMPECVRRRFAAGETKIEYQYRKLEREGLYKWYRSRIVRIDTGNPAQFKALSFTKNIDQDKLREERRLMAQHRFTVALRSAYLEVFEDNLTRDTCLRLHNLRSGGQWADTRESYSAVIAHDRDTLIHPDDREAFGTALGLERVRAAFAAGATQLSVESRRLTPDGTYRWHEVQLVRVEDPEHDDLVCMALLRDIDDRKRLEERQRLTEHRLQTALRSLYDEVHEIDLATGRYEAVAIQGSVAPSRQTGDYRRDIALYTELHVHPQDRADYARRLNLESLRAFFNEGGERIDHEYRRRTPAGGYHWCAVTIVREVGAPALTVMAFVQDIDAKRREEERMRNQAQRDSLTMLYNRATTETLIQAHLQGAGRDGLHAFIVIDIDDFKSINDSQGHAFGDRVLVHVATRLREYFRSGDVVGRVGGDEFVVFLKDVASVEAVRQRAEYICSAFRACADAGRMGFCISGSVGVALYDRDGRTFHDLFQRADIALYEAKRLGKDRYCFYAPDLDGNRLARTRIESDERPTSTSQGGSNMVE